MLHSCNTIWKVQEILGNPDLKMSFQNAHDANRRMFQMAIQSHHGEITMRRAVAHAVLYAFCFGSSIGSCFGAEVNSSWQPLGQAKVQKNIRTSAPFRPELSLEENNRLLTAHRNKSIIVSTTVPVKKLSNLNLVNHSASWQLGNQAYSGRVTAVTLSADQTQATIFAEIVDADLPTNSLKGHEAGPLSVEG